jgi:hypothetical protein
MRYKSLEAVVEGPTQLQSDLETEKCTKARIWNQIENVLPNTSKRS